MAGDGLVGVASGGQLGYPLFLLGQLGGVLVGAASAAACDSEFDAGPVGQPGCLAFLGDVYGLGQVWAGFGRLSAPAQERAVTQ